MKRRLTLLLSISILLTLSMGCVTMTSAPQLVPRPQKFQFTPTFTPLSDGWVILTTGTDSDALSAELIRDEVMACFGWDWKIYEGDPPKKYKGIVKIEEYKAQLPDNTPDNYAEQGYTLSISPKYIIINAPSETGRFYAAQTLRQVFRSAQGNKPNTALMTMNIIDWPALKWRGVSDDISRGQVSTAEDFIRIIHTLAYYKKNLYQPYIEDMFEFDTSPNVGKTRGRITKEEMAIIAAEAKKYHITLAPVFETLGHQDRMLSLEENRRFAERLDPDETPWSFSAVDPDARAFVKKLIDELAEATPDSPFFHIGGDESWDIGEGSSKERVEEVGIGKVHAEFYGDIAQYVQEKHNREVMVYADMLLRYEEGLESLPDDLILIDWHYRPADDYPSVKKLKDKGFKKVFASPGIWSWAAFYPNFRLGFANVADFTSVAKREGLIGCITSSWGDWGAENLRVNNWPALAFSAAAEWERTEPGADEFLKRFTIVHYGSNLPELAGAIKSIGWLDGIEMPHPVKRFHATPRIELMNPGWIDLMTNLEANMLQAYFNIEKSRSAVRFNADQLDPLEHAARRYTWMARRDKALERIYILLNESKGEGLAPEVSEEIAETLTNLRDELIAIANEFEMLWLRYYKYPMLQTNLERIQEQVAALNALLTRLKTGELKPRTAPNVSWFWYPDDDPKKETEKGLRYFVRQIEVEETPYLATLKCWVDDAARVYLDGKQLFRVEYGDTPHEESIGAKLTPGIHTIAIRASNNIGAAGVAFTLKMQWPDGKTEIISGDDEWRVTKEEQEGDDWKTGIPEGDDWVQVKVFGTGLFPPFDFLDW